MLTLQELSALAQLVERAPASEAERLWVHQTLTRIARELREAEMAKNQAKAEQKEQNGPEG